MAETLRAAGLADREACVRLLRTVGFKAPSEAGWRWLFEDNPAHQRHHPVAGWLLEDEGGVQGYLGNILLDYQLDGRPLLAATCTGWVVDPRARGDSLRLLAAFFKQAGPELFLTASANAESEAAYRSFKAEVPLGAGFAEGTVWVARDAMALRERGWSPALAPLSRLARLLSGRARVPRTWASARVQRLRPDEIDARFDRLWAQVGARPGLRRARDAASLRWTLSDPDQRPGAAAFVLEQAGELAGFALVAPHQPSPERGLQLRLVDLCVGDGQQAAAGPLLRRAAEHARELGAGLLYAPPCGAELSALLAGRGGHPVPRDHLSHFLRTRKRADTAGLVAEGRWAATGLDGDIPFVL